LADDDAAADTEAGQEGNDHGGVGDADDEPGSSTVPVTGADIDRRCVGGFAFAALKPLFDPKGVAVPRPWEKGKSRLQVERDTRDRKSVNPLPLVRLVEAGRVDEALAMAARIARGAGLNVLYAGVSDIRKPAARLWSRQEAVRLAAALLIPLSDPAIEALARRAYPITKRDQEEPE
jgi:hypothetical protein